MTEDVFSHGVAQKIIPCPRPIAYAHKLIWSYTVDTHLEKNFCHDSPQICPWSATDWIESQNMFTHWFMLVEVQEEKNTHGYKSNKVEDTEHCKECCGCRIKYLCGAINQRKSCPSESDNRKYYKHGHPSFHAKRSFFLFQK